MELIVYEVLSSICHLKPNSVKSWFCFPFTIFWTIGFIFKSNHKPEHNISVEITLKFYKACTTSLGILHIYTFNNIYNYIGPKMFKGCKIVNNSHLRLSVYSMPNFKWTNYLKALSQPMDWVINKRLNLHVRNFEKWRIYKSASDLAFKPVFVWPQHSY